MSLAEPFAGTRRLAAILAADVAGYSRMMGADEEGKLARLKEHRRELVDRLCQVYVLGTRKGCILGRDCRSIPTSIPARFPAMVV
jgi:hypothetical protein